MIANLDLLVPIVISALAILVTFVDVPLFGPVIGLAGLFVVPGWLSTTVLFSDNTDVEPETRFILTFGLGAALVALELVVLNVTGIGISRESVVVFGAAISLMLVGILILRRRKVVGNRDNHLSMNVLFLTIFSIVFLNLSLFVHMWRVDESYTEFYVLPRVLGEADGHISEVELVVSNHENADHRYRVVCENADASEKTVIESVVARESSLSLGLTVLPPPPASTNKVRLSLYRDKDDVPYRWLELIGGGCALIR